MNCFTKNRFFSFIFIWAIGTLSVLGSQEHKDTSPSLSKKDLLQMIKDLPNYTSETSHKKSKENKIKKKLKEKLKDQVKKKSKELLKKKAKKHLAKKAKKILIKKKAKQLLEKKEKKQAKRMLKKKKKKKDDSFKTNFSSSPQRSMIQNLINNVNATPEVKAFHEKLCKGSEGDKKAAEKILDDGSFNDIPSLLVLNTQYMRHLLNLERSMYY